MFPLNSYFRIFHIRKCLFPFGKDDFGITRLKEDPSNTPNNEEEISNSDPLPENQSIVYPLLNE